MVNVFEKNTIEGWTNIDARLRNIDGERWLGRYPKQDKNQQYSDNKISFHAHG
jgi:hypothetical protein